MEMISPTIFMPALLSTHRVGLSMAARIRLEGLLRLEPLLRVPEAVACRNGIVMSSFAWQLYLDGLHGLPAARRRICASDSRDNHGQSVGDGQHGHVPHQHGHVPPVGPSPFLATGSTSHEGQETLTCR